MSLDALVAAVPVLLDEVKALREQVTELQSRVSPAGPDVLKAQQAADLLQVNVATVQIMAKSGQLPAVLYGNGWKFSRAVLLNWVREQSLAHAEQATG